MNALIRSSGRIDAKESCLAYCCQWSEQSRSFFDSNNQSCLMPLEATIEAFKESEMLKRLHWRVILMRFRLWLACRGHAPF